MVHRVLEKKQKKTDESVLALLLKVLCCMDKSLHFLHTHNFLCKNLCKYFFNIFISHCFPPSLYVSTSQQKASQACHWHQLARSGCTGQTTKWPRRHCRVRDKISSSSSTSFSSSSLFLSLFSLSLLSFLLPFKP